MRLLLRWSGGPRVDLISILHDGRPVPWRSRIVDDWKGTMSVEYDAPAAEQRTIRVLVSFLGEVRTDLEMTCSIDGRTLEPVVRAAQAGNRWDVEQTWPAAQLAGEAASVTTA